jgi:S1-C subfamily serine protease
MISNVPNIVRKCSPLVVQIQVKSCGEWGTGSGTIVDDETILTCYHVIRPYDKEPESIKVAREKEVFVDAMVLKSDRHYDAATIRAKGFTVNDRPEYASYQQIEVGQDCIVLGYQFGIHNLTVTKGIISAKGRGLVSNFNFEHLQINASINNGSSGGPVFDAHTANLVGIVSLKYIPFYDEITRLHRMVENLPIMPKEVYMESDHVDVDTGSFYNDVNVSLKKISKALLLVPAPIGWVLPISVLAEVLDLRQFI